MNHLDLIQWLALAYGGLVLGWVVRSWLRVR